MSLEGLSRVWRIERELAAAKAALEDRLQACERFAQALASERALAARLREELTRIEAGAAQLHDENEKMSEEWVEWTGLRREEIERRQRAEMNLQATQRAWALDILDREGGAPVGLDDYLTRGGDCVTIPGPIAALVREMAPYPIGTCDQCGERAPLASGFAQSGPEARICAWPGGCARKEGS